jgi:predicted nucleic acid-binding protein
MNTQLIDSLAQIIDIAINRLDLEEQTNQISISVITQMELIIGCRNKPELQHLDKFINLPMR